MNFLRLNRHVCHRKVIPVPLVRNWEAPPLFTHRPHSASLLSQSAPLLPSRAYRTMHTIWVRLNAVVFFGLTVLLCLSLLAALSKIGHANRHVPKIHKLQLNHMKSLKNHGGVDRALLSIDLHVSIYNFSFLVWECLRCI